MDIARIKQMVSITDFLNFLGYTPTRSNGEWLHYHSPLREDKNPSFWVNQRTATCGDFADGSRIGDVINLAARYYNCDIATAAANIEDSFRLGAFSSANKHTAAQPTPPTVKNTTIIIKHVQPLQNAALLQYAQERGISAATAKSHLQEIYYKTADNTTKQYFALAFKNDQGGYELRNRYFKGSTTPKNITTIRQGSDTVVVFEGFMDFLSCIEYWKCHNKTMPYDVIVLNSLVFAAKTDLSEYAHIKLLLDNDTAGQRAAQDITTRYTNAINLTPRLLDGYKDFNEFWVKKYVNLSK